MKTMAGGEFKVHFSKALEEVKQGHPVAIESGKRKTKVAVIVPYEQYASSAIRRLGVMEERASYAVNEGFGLSDEELLSS